jgi:hypothetical protein
MDSTNYVGLDLHIEMIVIAVRNSTGKLLPQGCFLKS